MSPPENASSNVADTDTNGGRSATDSDVQSASGNRPLSPEFFDLISEADPHAAKDKFYTASPAFTDLHSNIKGGL
ncbi:MAG: hypothetical protein ACR2QS_05990, partial [Woeseiaceae bacterium]